VAWLPPELEIGEEPELRPLEPELAEDEPELAEDEPELAEDEPELAEDEPELELEFELEPAEPELAELEPEPDLAPEPELVEAEPDAVLCVDPGRTRASAPAVTTLAMVTAVVVDRTLLRPRSLAAMASRTASRCLLLMYPILGSGFRSGMHGPSLFPMSQGPWLLLPSRRGYPGNMKDS
jgi:hypothetical protein